MNQRPVLALVYEAIYPYSHGGRELRYQELLPRLAERAEVHVYTMHWWDGPRVYRDGAITYHAISKVLPMYTKNRRSIRQALHFGLASLYLLRCHFDVLEADQFPFFHLFILRVVAMLKRKPMTVSWHEFWGRSYWCEYLGWAGWGASIVEWLALRLPDHIITSAPETTERLRRTLGERAQITTVPPGIDFRTICSTSPAAVHSDIVVVGRLIDHKRVDMVLEAISLLHARGMKVTCQIVGDGPARTALEEKARTLGIADAVDFRSDVAEQKDVYAIIKSAKVFISLSTREGFGLAVLEAIACGISVLTTSAPDNLAQHLVGRYSRGVICEPSLESVVAAVQELLLKADGCSYRKDGIDSWVEDYDWTAMTDRLAGVYFA